MTTAAIDHHETTVVARMARDDDFDQIRELTFTTYPISPPYWNWEVRRWDGQRFHGENPNWYTHVRLWETAAGELVGVAHHEGRLGDAFLEIHPDYRHLIEAEMIDWAETNLSKTADDGQRLLNFAVQEYDVVRQALLRARGYEKTVHGELGFHWRLGNKPIAEPKLAEGYTLRNTRLGSKADQDGVARLLNIAFGRGDFHDGSELAMFTRLAPCFRPDLDYVVEAPDGSFVCYVGCLYDEPIRRGLFEPVCTHPDHQQRGLAKATMLTALHRLRELGAEVAQVGAGLNVVPSNTLYRKVGFEEAYAAPLWEKRW